MFITFEDYHIQVEEALNDGAIKGLIEAALEIQAQAVDNSRVDSGQLRGSWKYTVDEAALKATIGSPLENAIWEEFGTGEYGAKGNGRKGGWSYQDDSGNWHHTTGKKPNRTLQRAFAMKKNVATRLIEQNIKNAMK